MAFLGLSKYMSKPITSVGYLIIYIKINDYFTIYVPVQGLSPVNNCDRRDVEREILSSDMQTNIQFIGSLPNNIIKQVTISNI